MNVFLRDILPDEYDGFMNQVADNYAWSTAQAEGSDYESCLKRTWEMLDEDLPAGIDTPKQRFYRIQDGDLEVGNLWLTFSKGRTAGFSSIYISNIVIFREHRRRGYATAALKLIEVLGKSRGCKNVSLNVFAFNKGAQALYKKLGYRSTTMQLRKAIDWNSTLTNRGE